MKETIQESLASNQPLLIEKVRPNFDPEDVRELIDSKERPRKIYLSTHLESFDFNSKICENFTIINYVCQQSEADLKKAFAEIGKKNGKL